MRDVKETEARIRALTREVGTLREELRREVKKRERAVARSKELEELQEQSENRINELQFSSKKRAQELENTQKQARQSVAKNRQALHALREGLSQLEQAAAARVQRGQQCLHHAFQHLQALIRLPLAAAGQPGGSSAAVPLAEVQGTVREVMVALTELNASFTAAAPAGTAEAAENIPPAPAVASGRAVALLEEGKPLHPKTEAQEVYHGEVTRLRSQVALMQQTLQEREQQRSALREEVGMLQQALQERETAAAGLQRSCTQAQEELQQQLRDATQRGSAAELAAQRAQAQLLSLQDQVAEKGEVIAQQEKMMEELRRTIQEQQADVRCALELIMQPPGGAAAPLPAAPAGTAALPPLTSTAGAWSATLDAGVSTSFSSNGTAPRRAASPRPLAAAAAGLRSSVCTSDTSCPSPSGRVVIPIPTAPPTAGGARARPASAAASSLRLGHSLGPAASAAVAASELLHPAARVPPPLQPPHVGVQGIPAAVEPSDALKTDLDALDQEIAVLETSLRMASMRMSM